METFFMANIAQLKMQSNGLCVAFISEKRSHKSLVLLCRGHIYCYKTIKSQSKWATAAVNTIKPLK